MAEKDPKDTFCTHCGYSYIEGDAFCPNCLTFNPNFLKWLVGNMVHISTVIDSTEYHFFSRLKEIEVGLGSDDIKYSEDNLHVDQYPIFNVTGRLIPVQIDDYKNVWVASTSKMCIPITDLSDVDPSKIISFSEMMSRAIPMDEMDDDYGRKRP